MPKYSLLLGFCRTMLERLNLSQFWFLRYTGEFLELKYQWHYKDDASMTVDLRDIYGGHLYFLANATLVELLQFLLTYDTKEARKEWVHRWLRERYPQVNSELDDLFDDDASSVADTAENRSSSAPDPLFNHAASGSSTARAGPTSTAPTPSPGGAAAGATSTAPMPLPSGAGTSPVTNTQRDTTWAMQKLYYAQYQGLVNIPKDLKDLPENEPSVYDSHFVYEDYTPECDGEDDILVDEWNIVDVILKRCSSQRVENMRKEKECIESAKRGEYAVPLEISANPVDIMELSLDDDIAQYAFSNAARWNYSPTAETSEAAPTSRQSARIQQTNSVDDDDVNSGSDEASAAEKDDDEDYQASSDESQSGQSNSDSEGFDNINSQELEAEEAKSKRSRGRSSSTRGKRQHTAGATPGVAASAPSSPAKEAPTPAAAASTTLSTLQTQAHVAPAATSASRVAASRSRASTSSSQAEATTITSVTQSTTSRVMTSPTAETESAIASAAAAAAEAAASTDITARGQKRKADATVEKRCTRSNAAILESIATVVPFSHTVKKVKR